MSHKIIKPDLDLVFARFAIFGMLAILFAVSYANGHPSWLTWVVMLLGVFSIFEAAIKADEVAVEAEATQIRIGKLKWLVNHQHKIIKQQDQSIEELRASHHGEMIGHEVHLKKVKQERNELQTLYTQQGINMLKLQKRVDVLEKSEFVLARIKSITGKNLLESVLIKEVRQVLKGGEA
ncbi:hypothetical protein WDN63_018825 [Acinetobacter baumannii]